MTGPPEVTRSSTGRSTVVRLPTISTGTWLTRGEARDTDVEAVDWLSEIANFSGCPSMPPVALTCLAGAVSAVFSSLPRKDALPVRERMVWMV